MYGSLEGLSKPGLALELGEEIVQQWRGGYSARPPPMSPDHPHWHATEKKYADLLPGEIPSTESLEDTMTRTLPLWNKRIWPCLQQGQNVLIVAHGNSLRGVVKHIEGLTPEQIQKVGIPNGIPLIYKFEKSKCNSRLGDLLPIKMESAIEPLSGEFLEKKGLLRAALAREEELAKGVPGYEVSIKYNSRSC